MNIGNRDPRVTEYIAGSSLYFQELINTLTDIVFEAEPNMDEAIIKQAIAKQTVMI